MIDKNSPIPLYIQFKEYLLDQIRQGQLEPGERLPSERKFCKEFDISRITVRQALSELMRDGLIYSVPGIGTFVTRKQESDFQPLMGFSELVRRQGYTPSSQVLKQEIVYAATGLAEALDIPLNATVARIERLRRADKEPRVLQTAYISLAMCPDILKHDFEKQSLYQTLREVYDLIPVFANYSIEARLATPEETELLSLPLPSAVLVMRQTSFLEDGGVAEYTRSIYRSHERFHFNRNVNLGRSPADKGR